MASEVDSRLSDKGFSLARETHCILGQNTFLSLCLSIPTAGVKMGTSECWGDNPAMD